MQFLQDTGRRVLVAGAGGFIGGHMVARLRALGFRRIRAADIKPLGEWHQCFDGIDNRVLDLSRREAAIEACDDAQIVINLACNMGGMGFIEHHKAACMLSVLINTHLLMAARDAGTQRYLFASSACVYAQDRQLDPDNPGLKESDAYPAMAEDGYGWEKLFSERMCRHFREDFGLDTRVARYHNIYGPHGTWDGGREKAPAAICRKVIQAVRDDTGTIDIWGDGLQTRSFTFIDDCLDGTLRLLDSDITEPINIGSDEMVSINGLVDLVEAIAGTRLTRTHQLDAPLGVRGRNSDNTRVRQLLGWAPATPLRDGMRQTFRWIAREMGAEDLAPDA